MSVKAIETVTLPRAGVAPATDAGNRQIFGLDWIRFVAALMVMVHHFGAVFWTQGNVAPGYARVEPYLWSGWVGAEVFFVLSGFIIAYTAQKATPVGFLKNRFLRLYPAAWICSVFTLAVLVLDAKMHPAHGMFSDWLRCATLYPRGPYLDGSYWTLPVELAFYAVVFVLLLKRRIRVLGVVMGVLAVACLVSEMWLMSVNVGMVHLGAHGWHYTGILFNIPFLSSLVMYGCYFAMGALLWQCFFQGWTLPRGIVLVVCLVGAVLEVKQHGQWLLADFGVKYSLAPAFLEWSIAVAGIAAAVKFNEAIARRVSPRGAVITRRLGLITYPLYLFHQRVGLVMIAHLRGRLPDVVVLLVTMVAMIAGSFAIHAWLEKPLQQLLRDRVFHMRKRAVVPAGTLP